MATLTHNIAVGSDGSVKPIPNTSLPQQYYRKPHDTEIRNYDSVDKLWGWTYRGDGVGGGPVRKTVIDNNQPLPEVYRAMPSHETTINCDWLWLWRKLNPELSDEKFCTLLGNTYAFTNRTGFPGRKNCILRIDMSANDPAFHAPLICGGALLKGREESGYLLIEGMLTRNPVPTAEWVLERPWLWFYGVSINTNGVNRYMNKLGVDGQPHPIRIPILTEYPIKMPLAWLDRLPLGFIPPNPLWKPT